MSDLVYIRDKRVVDHIEKLTARIEALEAALREITTRGEEYDYPYAEEIARAALAEGQDK